MVFSCLTLIKVSCLHFGKKSGKFTRIVSSRILTLVLFLQTGHIIQLSFLVALGNSILVSYSHLKNLIEIPVQIAVTAIITMIGNKAFSIGNPRKVDFIN